MFQVDKFLYGLLKKKYIIFAFASTLNKQKGPKNIFYDIDVYIRCYFSQRNNLSVYLSFLPLAQQLFQLNQIIKSMKPLILGCIILDMIIKEKK